MRVVNRIQSIIDALGGGVYHSHLASMSRDAVAALKRQRLVAVTSEQRATIPNGPTTEIVC
jgi:hypothetical protein